MAEESLSGSADRHRDGLGAVRPVDPLRVADGQTISVAVVVADGAELVDVAGPWGVFECATLDHGRSAFALSTVAESREALRLSGGLTVVPDHTVADAPDPQVVVVPALQSSPALLDWLRRVQTTADLTMSVCNGAFALAEAGLLDGLSATCHHGAYGLLHARFPEVTLVRGRRYVESGRIATSGGLTCGLDLALRVVERYLGTTAAERVATDLEYDAAGWRDPTCLPASVRPPTPTPERALDPICEALVDVGTALTAHGNGTTHHFCGEWCRDLFLATPERFPDPARLSW